MKTNENNKIVKLEKRLIYDIALHRLNPKFANLRKKKKDAPLVFHRIRPLDFVCAYIHSQKKKGEREKKLTSHPLKQAHLQYQRPPA